jgi:hypothetical protein
MKAPTDIDSNFISRIRSVPIFSLGAGVLTGIVDTGIDYRYYI